MKNLILTLIITLPLTLLGQGWEQTFGDISFDEGNSVIQTNDGGYVTTGRISLNNFNYSYCLYLVKTDENGNELWSQTFGGPSMGIGHSVQQTTDGGFIITGWIGTSNVNCDVFLIKTNENGIGEWSQIFEQPSLGKYIGYSVQQTTDGGYIITGEKGGDTSGNTSKVYLLKTDENGNELWSHTFGGGGYDTGRSIQQTTEGGYILCSSSGLLMKTDEDGIEEWSLTFDGSFSHLEQTTDGGYIIIGDRFNDVYLVKTDVSGNIQWFKTFGGIYVDKGSYVQQTTDGGYVIIGTTNSIGLGDDNIYLIKTDENGNELWYKTFGGEEDDQGNSVQQTTDGGYIITGYTKSIGNGNKDVYLIKTNQFGNITSTFEIPLPNPNRKLEKTVNLKGQEIKPQKNTPIVEIFDDGSVEKKIVVE